MNAARDVLRPLAAAVVLSLGFGAFAGGPALAGSNRKVPMQLTSPAFKDGESIPANHTCDAKDISPPLAWAGIPPGTRSFALIVDDPDAPGGTWVHWVLFDAPPDAKALPQDLPKTQYLPGGAKQGLNDFKRLGYGGPCPPAGKAHRYFFKLYALNTMLDLKPGAKKDEVERAMSGHIIGEGQLMGTYRRK